MDTRLQALLNCIRSETVPKIFNGAEAGSYLSVVYTLPQRVAGLEQVGVPPGTSAKRHKAGMGEVGMVTPLAVALAQTRTTTNYVF